MESPEVVSEQGGLQLTPDEQKALDRVRGNKPDYVDENFNEDGTPKNDFEMPEKFKGKSTEDIVKAYLELEKLKSKQTNTEPPEDQKSTNDPQTTSDTHEDGKEVTEPPSGVVTPEFFKKFEEAVVKEGKLSDSHYKELESKGFSKEMVDTYIDGQKAKGQLYASEIYNHSGGQEAYNELVEWARDNLSDIAKKDFDDKIMSGNSELAKLAIDVVMAQRGTSPRRVEGTSNADVGGMKPFKDKGEWQSYVRNPLYAKDKKYTEMVDKRYLLSKRKRTL